MENIQQAIEHLGFTTGEAKVYLALLQIGESKVGPIIKTSQITRSKVYDILERLISKRVVSKVTKQNILYYQALPPHTLFNTLKEKEIQLQQEQQLLHQILPQLIKLHPAATANVMIYEGFAGFKAMIDRTIEELTKNDSYDAMGISETTEAMRHYARKIYEAQPIKKFKARSIFDEKGAHKIVERKNPLHQIRLLPSGWHTPALFTIYKDTVGIHLGNEESIISIVIKNADITKSFRTTFEAMWLLAKKETKHPKNKSRENNTIADDISDAITWARKKI